MKKLLFLLMVLPFTAIGQYKDITTVPAFNTVFKQDTVAAVIVIKRCNTCPMQPVSGYVIFQDCKPVGYLSGRKQPYPAKFKVCNQSEFYHLNHKQ